MFTGIIEALGRIEAVQSVSGGARMVVCPPRPLEGLQTGESISINGVCQTAEPASTAGRLVFFQSGETLRRSTLGSLKPGDIVNIERALRADSRLGGHFVMGHVDGVGEIRRFDRSGESWTLEVAYPRELGVYMAPKGSVAVDGISLTLAKVTGESFTVAVIPHTVRDTTLSQAAAGRPVNLEADMFARYVVRALEGMAGRGESVSMELLRRAGF